MIELSNGERYVTYLKEGKKFNVNDIHTIIGIPSIINKPDLAFWGSPVNSNFGWKEWMTVDGFGLASYKWDNPIYWSLMKNTKILRIDYKDIISPKYLEKYFVNPYEVLNENLKSKIELTDFMQEEVVLDFNKLLEDDIKAVELMDSYIGHGFRNRIENMFNSWDCESIVVLDESVICFEDVK